MQLSFWYKINSSDSSSCGMSWIKVLVMIYGHERYIKFPAPTWGIACFTRISTRVPAYYLLATKEEETVNHGVVNLPSRYKNHQVSLFACLLAG